MPISVRLEDRGGHFLARIVDHKNLLTPRGEQLAALNPRLLQYIDRYGLAVFNRDQMEDLMVDLGSLAAISLADEDQELIESLLELAKRCKDAPELYLRFYGD